MGWGQWVAASVEAVVLAILVLLWYDTLRERPGWTLGRATRTAGVGALSIPVGFVVALLVPLWVALIVIAVPALAIVVMALAS